MLGRDRIDIKKIKTEVKEIKTTIHEMKNTLGQINSRLGIVKGKTCYIWLIGIEVVPSERERKNRFLKNVYNISELWDNFDQNI